ncbi:MAG: hypothetical protein JOZ86_05355 [Candidatus Eremiobacteraeota bacterium]|nr:hypothetical protein [Candidatus Eremiobacteraeota bacterium]
MRHPALVLAAVLAAGAAASAATPAPKSSPRINVEQLQPKQLFPKVPLHVEYTVEVNKLGQVARVRAVKASKNPTIDAITYGNALQSFIRTPDGHVVLGTYKLTYDYDPKTQRMHRDVQLVRAGGVNPNAKGAAVDMMEIARHNRNRTPPPQPTAAVSPGPAPSVNIKRLPDLPQVMKSQTPSPSSH